MTLAQRVAWTGQDESGLMPDAEFSQGTDTLKPEFEQERERARSARPARSGRRSASSRGKKSTNRKVVRSKTPGAMPAPHQAAWAAERDVRSTSVGRSTPRPGDRSRALDMHGRARLASARDAGGGYVGGGAIQGGTSAAILGGQLHGSRMSHAMMQHTRAAYVPQAPPPQLSPEVLASAQELMDGRARECTNRGYSARASRSYRETMAMLIQGVINEPPPELQVTTRTPRDQKLSTDDLLSRNLMSVSSSTPRAFKQTNSTNPSMLTGGHVDPLDQILMLAGGRGRPRATDMLYEA